MAKAAVKSKKRAKPAKGKKHHRGVLDLPKAVETRMAEGRAERESVPLEAHGEWAAVRRASGPGRDPGGAERDARARAGADPPRAHDRLAVHVLPRWRGDHGVRISRRRRARGCACSAAVTRTCRTSACSRRRIDASCSISTTSTRRCRRRSSGTSSASSRASSSPRATTATAARSSARPRAPPPRRTARRWPGPRRCASSKSGTRGSTRRTC